MTEITNSIVQMYLQGGITLVVVVGFFIMLYWVLKESSKREQVMREDSASRDKLLRDEIDEIRADNKVREEKFMVVIENVSKDMPEIKEKLMKLDSKISEIDDKLTDIKYQVK